MSILILRGGQCQGGGIQIRTVQWQVSASEINAWDMSVIPWGQNWWSSDPNTAPSLNPYAPPAWISYNYGPQAPLASRSQVLVCGGCYQYMVALTYGGNNCCVASCTSLPFACGILEMPAPPDDVSYPPPGGCPTAAFYYWCMVGPASLPSHPQYLYGYSTGAPYLPDVTTWFEAANLDWWAGNNCGNMGLHSTYQGGLICDPRPGYNNLDPFGYT
jgi:hypothetical protein